MYGQLSAYVIPNILFHSDNGESAIWLAVLYVDRKSLLGKTFQIIQKRTLTKAAAEKIITLFLYPPPGKLHLHNIKLVLIKKSHVINEKKES